MTDSFGGQNNGGKKSFSKRAYGDKSGRSGQRSSSGDRKSGAGYQSRGSQNTDADSRFSGERSEGRSSYSGNGHSGHGNNHFGGNAGHRSSHFSGNRSERQGSRSATTQPSGGTGRMFGRSPSDKPQLSTGLSMNARRVALQVLCDVHENGAYASISLEKRLREAFLKPEDRALVTELVYGTIEKQNQIDYVLEKFVDHPVQKPSQTDILRMGVYQILFLDRVPDFAAVDEAVKLVKILGMEEASGFINAVLRNIVRGKSTLEWPTKEQDQRDYWHIMGNMPLWLIDRLVEAYGEEGADSIIMNRPTEHCVVVRPNLTRLTDAEFEAFLTKKGWNWRKGLAPHAYLLSGAKHVAIDPDYLKGQFSIQGQSSILCAECMQAKPGMKLLDACAAPGGKSAYLCETMSMTGRVYSWELHEKRAALLEATRKRLGLDNMRVTVRDSTVYKEDWENTLDGVLLDAPCSGTGVIAQKPDIPARLQESDLPEIVALQERLLNTVCSYVKPGGRLIYSTCSILPEENSQRIESFLKEHPEFEMMPLPDCFPEELRELQTPNGLQLIGHRDDVEGFFIAVMRRIR